MNYDFENYLLDKLNLINENLELGLTIYSSVEQNFAKMDELTPDSVYVVIKYLSSDIAYYAETMPIQILVLSEQNSLEKAQMLMNKFANDYNWKVVIDNGTFIKQQYNSPVVLNNYVEVSYGYRSVLYVTGTLYLMENVVDVTDVYIDAETNDEPYKVLGFNISYSMSTNTQQLADVYIASSVKTVSTFSISLTMPMIDCKLVTKVTNILNELNDTTNNIIYDGNNSFTIQFSLGDVTITKTMKLISVQIITAPNQVPSLQLGFMK